MSETVPACSAAPANDAVSKPKPVKERGPVEEVIARRLRPLVKKIQRIKNYSRQPATLLNADQLKALASLPCLEAACRELEELSKQVEETELVIASRAREERESEIREFDKRVQAKAIEIQAALVTPLSLFLRLYNLLHPARTDDHENLTFTRLVLPPNLKDEVTATDVLRVGRMYDDLLAGGAAAEAVLGSLIAGPTGVDEENDHVQQLLTLVSQPDSKIPEPSEAGHPPASVIVEPAFSVQGTLDADGDNDSGVPTLADSPISSSPNPNSTLTLTSLQANGPLPVGLGQPARGMPLNFLQADELAAIEVEQQVEEVESSVEPTIDVEESTPGPIHTPLPSAPIDWSAEDADEADDLVTAEHLRGHFASGFATPAAQAVEEVTPAGEITVVQEIKAESSDVTTLMDADTALKSEAAVSGAVVAEGDVPGREKAAGGTVGQGRRGRRPFRGAGGRPKDGREGGNSNNDNNGVALAGAGQVNGYGGRPGGPEIDADGFETVGGRRPSMSARGSRGGRGGRGTGFADRGRGIGRGRGGAAANGGRQTNGGGSGSGKQQNGTNGERRKDRSLTPVSAQDKKSAGAGGNGVNGAPKPSIYKAVQSSGPVSAPIF